MAIKEISKKALAHFKESGYIFTPDEYAKVFCQEAKKAKVIIKDCNKVAEYLIKLDKKHQLIAKNYNIKNIDDLVVFLINYLNREDSSKEKGNLEYFFNYTKRVLDVLAALPIITSKNIAVKHLDFLKHHMEKEKFNKLRNEWFEFLSEFDSSIVKKGARIAGIKSEDALDVIEALIRKISDKPDLEFLVDSLIQTLTPSYAPFMNDDIAMLKKQIKEDNSFILSNAFAEDLKILTQKRIKLDKKELKRKLKDLDRIAERLSVKILKVLKKTDGSSQEIKKIATELQNWRKDEENFETIKEKLLTLATSIDKEISDFKEDVKKENDEIQNLRKKVAFLESEVKQLSKEVKTDYLTNIANKKAIMEEIKKQESKYKRDKTDYSIVFFDIDHFKQINDTYGHEAGDTILRSLGMLFKRYTRDIDIIGRYGGEEFVAVLPDKDKKSAFHFAEKIRSIIQNTKFMYKNTRIDVTISGGVAQRSETNSSDEIIKLADKRLYFAKRNGRNKVCMDEVKSG